MLIQEITTELHKHISRTVLIQFEDGSYKIACNNGFSYTDSNLNTISYKENVKIVFLLP